MIPEKGATARIECGKGDSDAKLYHFLGTYR